MGSGQAVADTTPTLIAVDRGSANRRTYLLDQAGRVLPLVAFRSHGKNRTQGGVIGGDTCLSKS